MARFNFTFKRLRMDLDEASSSGDDGFNVHSDDEADVASAVAAVAAVDRPCKQFSTVDAQQAANGKLAPSSGKRQRGIESCETRGPHRKSRLKAAQTPSQAQLRQVEGVQRRHQMQGPRPMSRLAASTARTSPSSHAEVNEATSTTAEKPKVIVMRGDPTDWSTAAIVNDANTLLQLDSGLAAAIVRQGGWEIQRQCIEWVYYNGQVVIHAVGPNVGNHRWPTLQHQLSLRRAVRSALTVADELGVTSVTMPAISTGASGYPKYLAAQETVAECIDFCDDCAPTTLRLIVLMNEDEVTTSHFSQALREQQQQRQLKRQWDSIVGTPHEGLQPIGACLDGGGNADARSEVDEAAAQGSAFRWMV